MANMSASILRNIVSSVFGVKSVNVVLAGELPKEFSCQEDNSSGNLYSHSQTERVWGFHPTTGFTEIFGELDGYSQNADGSRNSERIITFADCEGDFLFYIHNSSGSYSDCNGRDDNWDKWTLYKAPNWTEIRKSIENIDITRWEQWLAE